ncbi:MAG TPA: DUF6677 family protein [Vicinamibacteria bacterium]|nr:DUF6677 family protein [Vicinamibacteria bacterium]
MERPGERAFRPGAAAIACLLGWLLPGAGHAYVGRPGRGAFFCLALLTLFGVGVSLDARLTLHLGLDDPLGLVIGAGQAALGLPYVLARALGGATGDVRSATFDYGVTFTATAGLLNVLVMLDAVDVALGRKA